MKATFRNSFAKRSLLIAATALPSLYTGLANAQTPPPATAPTAVAAPASAVVAPEPTTAQATGANKDAAVAAAPMPAPMVPPADAAPAAPMVPAEPVDPMTEKYKHIDVGVWFRLGGAFQKAANPKSLGGFGTGGDVEVHFSNQMRKSLLWTANFTANYGAPDGGSFVAPGFGGPGGVTGNVNVLDLIAQYEPDDAFHLWVGRMLVASDRSNFSGPWFMAPWIYPLFLGPQGNPYAIVGPQEGPNGRNDGATVWGQFAGGLFKYYAGVYRVFDAASPTINGTNNKPLLSGRLNLSLLNPEPGYYSSSTYYGMDILAIGVGGQYSKNQDPNTAASDGASDYGLFNADILFEKNLGASGVFDAEGAFDKYVGDAEPLSWSHFVLASYLTPDTGMGKLQPLVRLQQAIYKNSGPTVSQIDAQVTDVIDSYSTRVTLGFTHATVSDSGPKSNAIFAGVQIQK